MQHLFFYFRNILEPDLSSEDEPIPAPVRKRVQRPQRPRSAVESITDAIASRRKGAKQARRCEHCKSQPPLHVHASLLHESLLEPHHEKNNILHMRKQRRRSALR